MPVIVAALVVLCAVTATATEPHTFTGKVTRITDGDTVRVLDDDKIEHTIRLDGIDAPERRQPFGTKARDRLAELAMGKAVAVTSGKRDKYGRTVGRIEVEGQDVAHTLVAEGLAWHYTRYSDDERLADAQRAAKAAGRGVWGDRAPVPPWEWRATEKARKADKREPVGR